MRSPQEIVACLEQVLSHQKFGNLILYSDLIQMWKASTGEPKSSLDYALFVAESRQAVEIVPNEGILDIVPYIRILSIDNFTQKRTLWGSIVERINSQLTKQE